MNRLSLPIANKQQHTYKLCHALGLNNQWPHCPMEPTKHEHASTCMCVQFWNIPCLVTFYGYVH